MNLTIVTGDHATGKTLLINRLTQGLIREDCAFTKGDPTTLTNDEIPNVLVFDDGNSFGRIIKIIKKGRIFYRIPHVETFIPVPDIFVELNTPFEYLKSIRGFEDMLKTEGLIFSHIHLER